MKISDNCMPDKSVFSKGYIQSMSHLKFCVIWDDVSRMFWSTANLAVSSQGAVDLWRMGAKFTF